MDKTFLAQLSFEFINVRNVVKLKNRILKHFIYYKPVFNRHRFASLAD